MAANGANITGGKLRPMAAKGLIFTFYVNTLTLLVILCFNSPDLQL